MDKNDFGHSQERLKFGRVASALTDSGSYGPLPGMLEVKIGLNANYIVEHSLCSDAAGTDVGLPICRPAGRSLGMG